MRKLFRQATEIMVNIDLEFLGNPTSFSLPSLHTPFT